jgi:hypothetical protein
MGLVMLLVGVFVCYFSFCLSCLSFLFGRFIHFFDIIFSPSFFQFFLPFWFQRKHNPGCPPSLSLSRPPARLIFVPFAAAPPIHVKMLELALKVLDHLSANVLILLSYLSVRYKPATRLLL